MLFHDDVRVVWNPGGADDYPYIRCPHPDMTLIQRPFQGFVYPINQLIKP